MCYINLSYVDKLEICLHKIGILMCFLQCIKMWRVSWMIYSRSSGLSFGEVVAATVSLLKLACFFKSLFCFLKALEVSEDIAFILVGVGKVGVKADGLFVGG